MALKRIQKELNQLEKEPLAGVNVTTTDNNLFTVNVTITPTQNSPYYEAIYQFCVKFPPDYPFKAFELTCMTEIYHHSMRKDGCFCCSLNGKLRDNWSPALQLKLILVDVVKLLDSPVSKDFGEPCGSCEIFDESRKDPELFLRKARTHMIDTVYKWRKHRYFFLRKIKQEKFLPGRLSSTLFREMMSF